MKNWFDIFICWCDWYVSHQHKRSMTPDEIRKIFERTRVLFPELLRNPSYTPEHPAAEGLATIFKIKLDEFDRMNKQIEEGKKKCLSVWDGLHSLGQLVHDDWDGLDKPCTSTPTLGDFIKTPQRKGKGKRKHK